MVVFVIDKQCVYCEAETKFLNIKQMNSMLQSVKT